MKKSLTARFMSKCKFQSLSLSGNASLSKRYRKMLKKCGTCIHATLTKKVPLDGMQNEYYCETKKKSVKNTDKICESYDNRWKKKGDKSNG